MWLSIQLLFFFTKIDSVKNLIALTSTDFNYIKYLHLQCICWYLPALGRELQNGILEAQLVQSPFTKRSCTGIIWGKVLGLMFTHFVQILPRHWTASTSIEKSCSVALSEDHKTLDGPKISSSNSCKTKFWMKFEMMNKNKWLIVKLFDTTLSKNFQSLKESC